VKPVQEVRSSGPPVRTCTTNCLCPRAAFWMAPVRRWPAPHIVRVESCAVRSEYPVRSDQRTPMGANFALPVIWFKRALSRVASQIGHLGRRGAHASVPKVKRETSKFASWQMSKWEVGLPFFGSQKPATSVLLPRLLSRCLLQESQYDYEYPTELTTSHHRR
jgi:hypothetical protein